MRRLSLAAAESENSLAFEESMEKVAGESAKELLKFDLKTARLEQPSCIGMKQLV